MADLDEVDAMEAKIAAEMTAGAAGADSDEATRNLDANSLAAEQEQQAARDAEAAQIETDRIAAEVAAAGTKTDEEKAAEAEAARVAADEAAEKKRIEDEEAAEVAGRGKGPPRRVRIEALTESDRYRLQAVTSLAAAEGISLDEAMERLKGTPEQRAQAAATEPTALAALETKMEAVRAKLKEHLELRPLASNDLDELQNEREELRLAIRDEKAKIEAQTRREERQRVETEQQTYDRLWDESTATVEKAFPNDYGKADSPLHKAVIARLETIKNAKTPGMHGNPEVLRIVYADEAFKMGVAPKAAEAAVIPTPKVVDKTTRLLPAGGGTRQTPAMQMNDAAAKQALDTRRAEAVKTGDIDELMRINEIELTGKDPQPINRMRLTTA